MNTAPRKILVVDDEAIPRMLLSINLAEAEYIVQDADSGKKPCNCFEKNLSMLCFLT
jgi:CheY-like chemotaxis protein